MKYFVQFLAVLTDAEIQEIQNLQLRGKQKETLALLIIYRKNGFPKDAILEKLGISENHFFKISSILLDKCYTHFFGDDKTKLLKFLSSRDLFQNLKHEVLQLEKNPDLSYQLLMLIYDLLQRGSYKNHDPVLINHFAQRLLTEKPKLPQSLQNEIEYFIKLRRLRSLLFELAAKQEMEQARKVYLELLDYQKVLSIEQHPLACFHLNHALFIYLYSFENPGFIDTAYLQNAMKAFDFAKDYLDNEELIITSLKLCENFYYNSEFKQAFDGYQSYYKEYHSYFKNDFYHLTKYFQLSLITSKYKTAFCLLESHFKLYLDILHPSRGTMAALNYSKYYILNNDFFKAQSFLSKAMLLNDKNFYLPYEYEIRLLETTIAFMSESSQDFYQTYKKNYKYFKNKGLDPKQSGYFDYINYLSILSKKYKYKKDKETLLLIKKRFNNSSYAVYGKILSLCHNKTYLETYE